MKGKPLMAKHVSLFFTNNVPIRLKIFQTKLGDQGATIIRHDILAVVLVSIRPDTDLSKQYGLGTSLITLR